MQTFSKVFREAYTNPANRGMVLRMSDGTEIPGEHIAQNSFSVDRSCCSGKRLELGAVIASELTVKLRNTSCIYDEWSFEGEEICVILTARLPSGGEAREIIGYFTVDDPPRKLSTIKLSALDRMVHLDKPYDSTMPFPATVREIYYDALDRCNLISAMTASEINSLPNIDYVVSARPEEDGLTYRQIMSWVAELAGTVAYIDHNGEFRLATFPLSMPAGVQNINPATRFSSDLQERDITVTGVQVFVDEEAHLSGSEGYVLNIEENALITHDPKMIADNLGAVLIGFTYRPFKSETQAMPNLWPMDPVVFVDNNANECASIVTNITISAIGHTSISAKGETTTQAGYASLNPLTKGEKVILAKLKREQNARLDSAILATFHLNQLIGSSLGLYATDVPKEDGSTVHYWHDAETIEDSMTIYTFGANGYAWTTSGWNGGSPVWHYGFDKNGNAVYHSLYAHKITADMISVESLQAISAKIGGWTIGDTYLQCKGNTGAGGPLFVSLDSYKGQADASAFRVYDSSGTYFAVKYDGSMVATKGEVGGWTIDNDQLLSVGEFEKFNISSAKNSAENWITATYEDEVIFKLDKQGKLTATKGEIGGWKIDGNQLTAGGPAGSFTISSESSTSANWITAASQGIVTFKVDKKGKLTATDADVSGKITAKEGHIGGWVIGESYFGTEKAVPYGASKVECGFYIASADDNVEHWIRAVKSGDVMFSVSRLGVLTATEAIISGDITATSFKAISADNALRSVMTNTGLRVEDNSQQTSNGYAEIQKSSFEAVNTTGNYYFGVNGTKGGLIITEAGGRTIGSWMNSAAVADASDESVKHCIASLPEVYSAIFDALRPVVYKYNDGTSNRYHTGLIAQEVERAVLQSGLTTKDLAAFIRDDNGRCWLRYSEFIAINIAEIQKLKARVAKLERKVLNGG